MIKWNAWISAARLRTLPLSVSGIVIGTSLAGFMGYTNSLVFFLAICTTIGFQITSNFANDYGDGIKGTDNADRIGPMRAFQTGALSKSELKVGIVISAIISLILAFLLIYRAFSFNNFLYPLVFGLLGMFSVWAAIKYTVGDSAYGYYGLGDIFVFVFFGLLAVLGSMFLYTKFLTLSATLPAIGIGLLCTAVLNLNNLRDHVSDKKSNKNTLVVKMGYPAGITYHTLLIILAFSCFFVFILWKQNSYYQSLPLIAFFPIFLHLKRTRNITSARALDPELKTLALSTFFLSVLFYICFNIFS